MRDTMNNVILKSQIKSVLDKREQLGRAPRGITEAFDNKNLFVSWHKKINENYKDIDFARVLDAANHFQKMYEHEQNKKQTVSYRKRRIEDKKARAKHRNEVRKQKALKK